VRQRRISSAVLQWPICGSQACAMMRICTVVIKRRCGPAHQSDILSCAVDPSESGVIRRQLLQTALDCSLPKLCRSYVRYRPRAVLSARARRVRCAAQHRDHNLISTLASVTTCGFMTCEVTHCLTFCDYAAASVPSLVRPSTGVFTEHTRGLLES